MVPWAQMRTLALRFVHCYPFFVALGVVKQKQRTRGSIKKTYNREYSSLTPDRFFFNVKYASHSSKNRRLVAAELQ